MKWILIVICISFFLIKPFGQSSFFQNSDTLNKNRLRGAIIAESVLGVSSILVLNEVWYKNYPRSTFHFFDDSDEWLQIDKFGHATTSYYMGLTGIEVMKWSGFKGAKRSFIGGSLGFIYLAGVELLDGFSDQWGFSNSDVLANAAGTALVIAQDLAWQEQRFRLKISTHLSPFAKYRPNLLGSSLSERLLKDYNGQTIWLSANISSFLPEDSKFPKCLSVSVGIGGEEMISGKPRTNVIFNGEDISKDFNRYRQYYLSLDLDLSYIKTKNKFIKGFTSVFGLIKFPFPTIEFSKQGVKFYPVYF